MLAAVELDGDSRPEAGEVEDVGADGVLSAETVAGDAFAAQARPEQDFGVGGVLAEFAGEVLLVGHGLEG